MPTRATKCVPTAATVDSVGSPVEQAATDEDIKAYFERTATPEQRVEIWLDNIETSAKAAQAECDKTLEARQSRADAALARYDETQARSAIEDAERAAAAQAVAEALNAVRPPVWQAAREALINVGLIREAHARNALADAVEASLRAVNAWWRMRTLQFEKQIRHGFEGLKARSEGGKKRAAHLAEETAARNIKIRQSYERIQATRLHDRAETIKMLARSSGLSTKQVRRIVLPGTRTR